MDKFIHRVQCRPESVLTVLDHIRTFGVSTFSVQYYAPPVHLEGNWAFVDFGSAIRDVNFMLDGLRPDILPPRA